MISWISCIGLCQDNETPGPVNKMQISLVAIGSRGDVQPYIALGLGLQRSGYRVQFCADRLFESLVTSTGLTFSPVTAVPVDMMQQNVSRLRGPIKLMGWLNRIFRPLARQFFSDLYRTTERSDAILFSTLAFAGYHVAEKRGIPALGVYTVPITPTHAFHNLSFPAAPVWLPFKGSYNWWSFKLGNQLYMSLVRLAVNECRREVLSLKALPASFYWHLDVSTLPMVYGYSSTLLPRPSDWGLWLKVSGYWFLEEASDWQPPDNLLRFVDAGKPPIYIGFGSMIDEQIKRATHIVLGALKRLGKRGILMGGWGGLGAGDLPDRILRLEAVPHPWLFPRVSAVVHHGGSGTTATGLRYGKPTVIVPFFADQPFWGERVHALGCGPKPIPFARLSIDNLSEVIDSAVNTPVFQQNATVIGKKLQAENGVGKAVGYIQEFLEISHLKSTNLL
jgi:sterol 3beta-glucosyltransferase